MNSLQRNLENIILIFSPKPGVSQIRYLAKNQHMYSNESSVFYESALTKIGIDFTK